MFFTVLGKTLEWMEKYINVSVIVLDDNWNCCGGNVDGKRT